MGAILPRKCHAWKDCPAGFTSSNNEIVVFHTELPVPVRGVCARTLGLVPKTLSVLPLFVSLPPRVESRLMDRCRSPTALCSTQSPLSVQESSSVPEYILSFHSCLVRVPLPLLLHPPFLQAEPPAAPPDTGPRCSGLTIFTLCTCRAAPMSCVHK